MYLCPQINLVISDKWPQSATKQNIPRTGGLGVHQRRAEGRSGNVGGQEFL
jgi:hypothetical protein